MISISRFILVVVAVVVAVVVVVVVVVDFGNFELTRVCTRCDRVSLTHSPMQVAIWRP